MTQINVGDVLNRHELTTIHRRLLDLATSPHPARVS